MAMENVAKEYNMRTKDDKRHCTVDSLRTKWKCAPVFFFVFLKKSVP